jgi:hypothetical protein
VTENNLLREAVFKGLREDREMPAARTPGAGRRGQEAAGLFEVSHEPFAGAVGRGAAQSADHDPK